MVVDWTAAADELGDGVGVGVGVVEAGGVEVEIGVDADVETMRRGMLDTGVAVSSGVLDAEAGAGVVVSMDSVETTTVEVAASTLVVEVASVKSSPALTQMVCTSSTIAVTMS